MDQIKSVFTYKCPKLKKASFQHLTLFELDPNTCIILNLSDHLSIPANDDSNSKSGHNHLEGRGKFKIISKIISKCKGRERRASFTSRVLPPILDPKSALPTLKSPWSFSLMSFTTSSRACYKGYMGIFI